MKAITLWQPWASLLACGAKRYETRSWPTSYRGSIAIHAAKQDVTKIVFELPTEVRHAMFEAIKPAIPPGRTTIHHVPCGYVIAIAELVGCYEIKKNPYDKVRYYLDETGAAVEIKGNELLFGDFTPERYAWKFRNMKMLPEPIPAKGKQKIWEWAEGGF